jgi:hypothetical protein
MRRSVALRPRVRDSIEEEFVTRIRIHQQRIARVKTARARTAATGAPHIVVSTTLSEPVNL